MRLRTKFLFLFLGSGLFLLLEALAAAWSLSYVGGDVDNLQAYTQTDDMCGQLKAELAQVPDLEAIARRPSLNRRMLTRHADRTLVLCRTLRELTESETSRQAIERIEGAAGAYRKAGRAYALALEAERGGFPELDAAEGAYAELRRLLDEGVVEPIGHEARLATKRVVDNADALGTWVSFGGIMALVVTVVVASMLARATAKPFIRLVRGARQMGQGELERIDIGTEDELSELAEAFNDMTARLRAYYAGLEDEVRKRTEELRQREHDLERERRLAAIGRLAAGVAHEVSNPLTVIAGAAEGLRDRARDDELQRVAAFEDFPDYLETIESEAYRLKRVVRRLLDFSRRRPTVLLPLDLREVVSDAVSLAQLDRRARERPIRFPEEARPADAPEGAPAPALPPLPVRGDADALKEALLNLLFNALTAVEGGGEVTVRTLREGGQAIVEVSDTGSGIDPADLDRLFEPFFTTGAEGVSTGLGLSLVYGTVERHGGAITAHSDGVGRGARFRLSLPLAG